MSFIEKTEKKFGRYAIPNLTMKLVVFQVLFFIYYMIALEIKTIGNRKFLDTTTVSDVIIKFNIGDTTIISDIIYILGNPSILPTDWLNIIFFFFATNLLLFFGHSLEELWGKYKYNLYVLTTVLFALLSSQVFKYVYPEDYWHRDLIYFSSVVYTAIFFAFATYYPKFELLLFFILPTPIRFLAYLSAGVIIVAMFSMSNFDRVFWGLSTFGSYILFHYPILVNSQLQKVRKTNFDKQYGKLDSVPFHKCKICGQTEHNDEKLEFRITDDGEEYCINHLPK